MKQRQEIAKAIPNHRHVVELFAFLNNSCRLDDGYDREHGQRAARFSESMLGTHLFLPDQDFELLVHACTTLGEVRQAISPCRPAGMPTGSTWVGSASCPTRCGYARLPHRIRP